jgi:hypothetical protein
MGMKAHCQGVLIPNGLPRDFRRSGCYCAVPQDAVDDRIIDAQAIQIGRQTSAKPMPPVPQNPSFLEKVFHLPLVALIQIERSAHGICKDRADPRIPAPLAMCTEPVSELRNNGNGAFDFSVFGSPTSLRHTDRVTFSQPSDSSSCAGARVDVRLVNSEGDVIWTST